MNKSQRIYENKPDSPSNNVERTSEQELFITCHQCHVVYNYSQTKPVFLANGEESGERICDECRIQNVKKTTRCNLHVCSSSQYKANSFRTLPSKFFDLPDGRYKREIIQQFGINKSTKACCNLCYIKLTKAALLARQSIDSSPEVSSEADENNNHGDENADDSDPKTTLQPKKSSLLGKYTSNDVTSWVDKIKKRREQSVKQISNTNDASFQSRSSLSSTQTNKDDEPSTSDNQINENLIDKEKVLEHNLSKTAAGKHQSSGIIESSQPARSKAIKEKELSINSNGTLRETTPSITDDESGKHSNEQDIQSVKVTGDDVFDKDKSCALEKKEIIFVDASDSDDDSVIIIDEPNSEEAATSSILSELDNETADDTSSSDSQPAKYLCETCDNLVEKGIKECVDCSKNRKCIVLDCKTRKEELELKELPIKYSKLSRSEKKVFQKKFGLSKVSQKACNFCHKWIVYTLDTVFGELDSSNKNESGKTLYTENETLSEDSPDEVLSCSDDYGKKHKESISAGTEEDINTNLPTSTTVLNFTKSVVDFTSTQTGKNPVSMKPHLARRTPQINTSTVTSHSILSTQNKTTDVAPESTKIVPKYPISLSQVTNATVGGVKLTKSLEDTGLMSTFLGEVNRKEKVVPIKLNTDSLPHVLAAKIKDTSTISSQKSFTTSLSSISKPQPVFQSVTTIDNVAEASKICHSITTVSTSKTYPVISTVLSLRESKEITTNPSITSSSELSTYSKSLIQSVTAIDSVVDPSRTYSVTTVSSCKTYPVVSTVSSMGESTKMSVSSVTSSPELSTSSKSTKKVDTVTDLKESNKLSESLRLSLEKARKLPKASTSSSKPTIHQFNHESKGNFEVSRSFKKGKAISGKSQFLKPGSMVNSGKCKFSICALPNQIQQLFHFSHFWDSCTPMQTVIISHNFKIKKLKKSVCCYSCFKELKWYLAFLNDEIMEKISIEKTDSSKKKIFYVCQVGDCETTQRTNEPIQQWLHCYDDLLDDETLELREKLIKKFNLDETGKGFCCYSCLHKIRLYLDSCPGRGKVIPSKTTEPDVSTPSPAARVNILKKILPKPIQEVSVCQPIAYSTASIITVVSTAVTPVTSVNVTVYPKPPSLIATQSDRDGKYSFLASNSLDVGSKSPSTPESSIMSTKMIITTDANNVGYQNDASIYPVVDKVVSLGRTSYPPPLQKELTPTFIKIQGDTILPVVESSISKKSTNPIETNAVVDVTTTKNCIPLIAPSYYVIPSKPPPLKTIPILPKCHLVPISRISRTTATNQQVLTISKPATLPNYQIFTISKPATLPNHQVLTISKPTTLPDHQVPTMSKPATLPNHQVSTMSKPATLPNYQILTISKPATLPNHQVLTMSEPATLPNHQVLTMSEPATLPNHQVLTKSKPATLPNHQVLTISKPTTLPNQLCAETQIIVKSILQKQAVTTENTNPDTTNQISLDRGAPVICSSTTPSTSSISLSTHLPNTPSSKGLVIIASKFMSPKKPFISPTGKHETSRKLNILTSNNDNMNSIIKQQHTSKPIEQNNPCSKQGTVSDCSTFSSVSSTATNQVSVHGTTFCQSSTALTTSNEFGAFFSIPRSSPLDTLRKSSLPEQETLIFDEKNGDSSEEVMTKAVEYTPADIEYFDSTSLFDFSNQFKQVSSINSSEKKEKSNFSSNKETAVINASPAKDIPSIKANSLPNVSSTHSSTTNDLVNAEDTSLDKSMDVSFDESREDVKSPVFLPASLLFPNKFKVSDPKQSTIKVMGEKYIDFEKSSLLSTIDKCSVINISSQSQTIAVDKLSGNAINENSRNVTLPHSTYTKELLKTIDSLHTTMSVVESKENKKHVVPVKENVLDFVHGKNKPYMLDKMCQSDFSSETFHQQIIQLRVVPRSDLESTCTKQTQTQYTLKLDKICQTGLIYVNGSRDGCVGGTLKEPYTAMPESNLKKAVRKEAKELLDVFMRKLDELTLGCGKEILSELTHSKVVGLAEGYKNIVRDQGQLYRQTDGKDKNERLRLLSSVSLRTSNALLRTHFKRYSPKGDLISVNEDEIKQSRLYADQFGPGRPVFAKHSAPTMADATSSGTPTTSTHTTTKKTKAPKTIHKPVTSSTAVISAPNSEFFEDVVSPLTLLADASASIANKDMPSTDKGEVKDTASSELHISSNSIATKMPDNCVIKNTYDNNGWVSFFTKNKRKADSNISHIISKKKRTKFTDEEVNVLEQFFIDTSLNGKKRDMQELQDSLTLDKRTVSRWLRNRKYKEKQDEYVRNLQQMVANNDIPANNWYDNPADKVTPGSVVDENVSSDKGPEGSLQVTVDFSNGKENNDTDRNSDGEIDVVTVSTLSDVETETDTIPYGSDGEGMEKGEGKDDNDKRKEGKELQSKDRKSLNRITELAYHGIDEKTTSISAVKEPSELISLDSCPIDAVPFETCYESGFPSSQSISSKPTPIVSEMPSVLKVSANATQTRTGKDSTLTTQQNTIQSSDLVRDEMKNTSSSITPLDLKTLYVKPFSPATKSSGNEMSKASHGTSDLNTTSVVTTTLSNRIHSKSPVDFVLSESPFCKSSSSRETMYKCETPVDPAVSSETPNVPGFVNRVEDPANFDKTPISSSSTDSSYYPTLDIETPKDKIIEKRIAPHATKTPRSPVSNKKTDDQKDVVKTLDFLLSCTSASLHSASTPETGIEEANNHKVSADEDGTRLENITNTSPSVSKGPPLLVRHQTIDSSKVQHLRPDLLLSSQPPVLKTSHITHEMSNSDENTSRSSLDPESSSDNNTDKDPVSCNDVIVSDVSETYIPISCSSIDSSVSQTYSPNENSTIVSTASKTHPVKGVSFVDSTLSETSPIKPKLTETNSLSETHLDVNSQSSVILTDSDIGGKKIIENKGTEKISTYPNRVINEGCSLKRKICEIVPASLSSFSDDESPQSSYGKDVLISYKSPKKGKVIWYHRPDKVSEVNQNFIRYKKRFGLHFCTVDVVPLELTDLMKCGRYMRRLNRKRSVKPNKQGFDTKSSDPLRPNTNLKETDDPFLFCTSSTDASSSNTLGTSIEEEKRNNDTQVDGDFGLSDSTISNKSKSASRHSNQRLSNISNNLSLIIPKRKKFKVGAAPDFLISKIGDKSSNEQSMNVDDHDIRFKKNISDTIHPALISCSSSESSVFDFVGDSPQPPVLTPYLAVPRPLTSPKGTSKSPSINSPPVLISNLTQDKIT